MLELDLLVAPAKPWLDTFRDPAGMLLEDAPLEATSEARRPPHLTFSHVAPGSASNALEWVAAGARLRVESARVRWLIVHIPVTELRGPVKQEGATRPECGRPPRGLSVVAPSPPRPGLT